jgi:hypothetical protein
MERQQVRVTYGYRGQTFSGIVKSRSNHPIKKGEPYDMGTKTRGFDVPENWYVEMHHDEQSSRPTGSYDYIKQFEDGIMDLKFYDANGQEVD